MATSGVTAYATSTLEIITEALELLGVLGEGESPTTAQITSMKRTLNNLCKGWQADGLNIFAVQRMYLFLDGDSTDYNLYSGSSARFATNYVADATTTNTSSGATSVTVADGSKFTNGGIVGVTQAANTLFANITGIAGNTITFDSPLTEDILEGALVFGYSAQASQPMQVMDIYLRTFYGLPNNFSDRPITLLSRKEYSELSNKNAVGTTTQVQIEPQRAYTTVRVWPLGNGTAEILVLWCQRRLDTFTTDGDEPDYPQEWYLPLTYNLAMASAAKYGVPTGDFNRIASLATMYYDMAKGYDKELYTSVSVEPRYY
jgi:hypothetical protein